MPQRDLDADRLRRAMAQDERVLRPFREKRTEMIRDYATSEYGEWANTRPTYLNLMFQAADTYVQSLVANRPRVLVNTPYRELRWFAKHFQRALNNHIKEIHLEEELRMWVLDAFFCLGVMKIYYASDVEVKLEGTNHYVDPGKPYAEHISLDNFGFDTGAGHWKKIQYAWDEYRVTKHSLLDDPDFEEHRDVIKSAKDADPIKAGREDEAAASVMFPESEGFNLEPMVRLRDIWLPYRNQVVTMIADSFEEGEQSGAAHIIRRVDWEGPENGPYRYLTFSDVPDNIIGVSPGMVIKKLADLINSLYRKQVNQARRARDIPIYEGESEDDAKRLEKAEDGRWTRVKHRDGVGVLKLGGVDASNQQFTVGTIEMLDRMAGNLPAMAGLGAQAETLGQDQIIQQQVSTQMAKKQGRVVEATVGVLRDLGWLLWNDTARTIASEVQIPGTNMSITSVWTPEHREGKFILYNFDLEPYSMNYQSPSQRSAAINAFVGNMVMPLSELMMAQGGNIDVKELFEYYAELNDLDRLKDIVTFPPGAASQFAPQMHPPPRAGNTTRTHVRRNVSTGGTPQNRNAQTQQALTQLAQQQQQSAMQGVQ